MTDVIIIGGGLNGLVAAITLARRKYSVLLLERHDQVGGAAVTRTSAAGFKHATLSHALGPLSADVVRALRLDREKIEFIRPEPVLTTLAAGGPHVTFHRDHVLTAASINRVSAHDAGRWQAFVGTMQRLAGVIAEVNRHPAPSIDSPGSGDVWRLLQVGRRARALGRADLAKLGRYVPIAVADLVSEWFEHDLVQAAIAARAIFGHPVGPWSAGSGALLLQRMAEDPLPVGGGVTVKGGPGALTHTLAEIARRAGVEIRTNARVTRVLTHGQTATGVSLESGEEIRAHAVVAAIPPRHLFETLVDPAALPVTFRRRVRQIRSRGVTAKINLSLSARPEFAGLDGDEAALRGRLLIAPSIDALERAHDAVKYGDASPLPWLEISVPSANDEGLAPAGQHVMSIYAHHAPAGIPADVISQRVWSVLREYSPALESQVVEQEVITADDLNSLWGLTGGHIFHGEGALDQWWVSRPLLGWAHHYAAPIGGLFLAGAGSHPGGGLTGQTGLNAARAISVALGRRRR